MKTRKNLVKIKTEILGVIASLFFIFIVTQFVSIAIMGIREKIGFIHILYLIVLLCIEDFLLKKSRSRREAKMETSRIKLKDFLTLVDEDMLVDIVYRHISECGFTARELFIKRPELENTYIKPHGIAIHKHELDYILAKNSEERKKDYFENLRQNEYEYLLIEVED